MTTYRTTIDESDIRLTNEAHAQLAALYGQIDDDDIEAIRIYVTGGGCAGMTYGMTFTDRKMPYDKVLERDGFSVYVDAIALNYLGGAEIDYVSRPTGDSFVFNNVFAATGGSGTCSACGGAAGGCS